MRKLRDRLASGRLSIASATAAIVVAAGLVAPTAASAEEAAEAAAALPDTVSADALPTWQINGVVYSQAIVGDTVYVTGGFTRARPPGVAPGGPGEVVANNIFAYSLSTGNRVAAFDHQLNAQGRVIRASLDNTRLYVGGDFTTVDGQARAHIAAFNLSDNSLNASFRPAVSSQVRGIGITATTIYAGGAFGSVNGVPREGLAAFQPSNGALTSWAPTVDNGYVWALTMTPDKSKVIAGGSFTTLNGSAAYGMGAVSAATGATLPWAANSKIRDAGDAAAIVSLKADATQIIGSGYSFGGGGNFEGTFGLNPDTGAIIWVNDCLGDTYDVSSVGQVLYAVSHAHNCAAIDNFPDTSPRVRWMKATAQVNYPTNVTTLNDAYGWDYRGYSYAKMLHWWPELANGSYTASAQAAWAVDSTSEYVVLGGEFPRVNGVNQQGLVRMRSKASAPNLRGPRYTTTPPLPVPATNASALSPGSVKVSWGSAWDQDDEVLTYRLRRNGAIIHTVDSPSSFWKLPRLAYVDRTVVAGQSYTYQVQILDPEGNVQWSPVSNSVTATSGTPSAYETRVAADGATDLWRLGEGSGSAVVNYIGGSDMTLSGGYTRNVAGALVGDTDRATRFGGTNSFAVNSPSMPGPNVFSQEAWFRTSSSGGGKIMGYGDRNTGNSSNYDRHIYMDGSGRVYFGVYNNGSFTIQSGTGFNNGQWHHVVTSLSPSGMALYLDGNLIGTRATPTVGQSYTGYWRIGGDSTWTGNRYFNGDIDEVAVYSSPLTLSQVKSHYDVGRGIAPSNLSPTASFTHSENGLTVSVDGSGSTDSDGTIASYAWNFGNGTTATGATASRTYAAGGTYQVTLTVTDDKGATDTQTQAVTVVAPPPNAIPNASFTHSENGLTVSVNGSGSNDPDGTIASYAWNFGDGSTATGVTASRTYAAGGTYQVTLTVTDDDGATDTQTQPVTVVAPPPNQAPTASFTHSENGLSVSVSGSASSDPDGTIASYAWNFGDGSTATGVTASRTYAAAGTYQVTLTVTDDDGASDSVVQPVTVEVPVILAQDNFNRTVANGWGSANPGGAWTLGGTLDRWSVDGTQGNVSLNAGNGYTAYLPGVSTTNSETLVTFTTDKTPTGGGQYVSVLGRRVTASADYRTKIRFAAGGAVSVWLVRTEGGVENVISSLTVPGLSYTAGDRFQVRLQVTGTSPTTVRAKVWETGGTEPTAWTLSGTDSSAALQQVGSVALFSYLSGSTTNAPVVFGFDDLSVRTP